MMPVPADRPERRNHQPQKEDEQRDHRGRRYVIPSSDQTDEVFGTHRLWLAAPRAVAPRGAFNARKDPPNVRTTTAALIVANDPLRSTRMGGTIELVRAQSAIIPRHQPVR
jgi:hypothetical protein